MTEKVLVLDIETDALDASKIRMRHQRFTNR